MIDQESNLNESGCFNWSGFKSTQGHIMKQQAELVWFYRGTDFGSD